MNLFSAFRMKSRRHFRSLRDFAVFCLPVLFLGVVLSGPLAATSRTSALADEQELRLFVQSEEGPGHGTVCVEGLPSGILNSIANADPATLDWQRFFSIYTGDAVPGDGEKPPVIGSYLVDGPDLRFSPRFPFVRGLSYSARFSPDALSALLGSPWSDVPDAVEVTFTLPKPVEKTSTIVSRVFPSQEKLPENLLKFYIHFSAPMSMGDAYDHIHLLHANGEEVAMPFLDLKPELWDPDGRRLTLFFDPGRIKRGLRPHEDLGMALQTGKSYELHIDHELWDADGNRLKDAFSKRFTVIPADRTSPDYRKWQVVAPPAGTNEMLVIRLDEPLDHALLGRMLRVEDREGGIVNGTVEISGGESEWSFLPDQPWRSGRYSVIIDPAIEDLAGNKPLELFDVDVTKTAEHIREETLRLTFNVE